MAGGLVVRCDASDFGALTRRTRNWDAVLERHLRAEFRAVAEPLAAAARANARALRLDALPPSPRPSHRSRGTRLAIAASVRVEERVAGGVGYRVSAGHELASATNAPRFRHPTFGRRGGGEWVTQRSQPWWDRAVDTHRRAAHRAAAEALAGAVGEI